MTESRYRGNTFFLDNSISAYLVYKVVGKKKHLVVGFLQNQIIQKTNI